MNIQIIQADLHDPAHENALVELIDSYARGPGGQNAPISQEAREKMGKGILQFPHMEVLFAMHEGKPVGTTVLKWGFSTFSGRKYINIHDFSVFPEYRGKGIGRALMKEVERRAREQQCSHLSLEVNASNEGARRLYASEGFGPWDSPILFVRKPL